MYGRGSRGDYVKVVQAFLNDAGLYDGMIDGQFGPVTERAVKEWQSFTGAKVDGVWGPKTNRRTVDQMAAYAGEVAGNVRPAMPTPGGNHG